MKILDDYEAEIGERLDEILKRIKEAADNTELGEHAENFVAFENMKDDMNLYKEFTDLLKSAEVMGDEEEVVEHNGTYSIMKPDEYEKLREKEENYIG